MKLNSNFYAIIPFNEIFNSLRGCSMFRLVGNVGMIVLNAPRSNFNVGDNPRPGGNFDILLGILATLV